jgi:membrane associated rhomboid family serine protease
MLEDRSYMRQDSFRPQWSMTLLLLAVNVAVFFLQKLVGPSFEHNLALSNRGLAQGHIWELLTFQFLHGSFFHLLFNCLAIFFFGRLVEDRLGRATFLKIYLISGTVGGLFHCAMAALMPQHFGMTAVVGASAGALGLLAAATMLDPNMTILAYFIIPIRAKFFLYLAGGFSLLYMVLAPNSQTAHSAHLGGLLAGVAYMRWGSLLESFLDSMRARSASRRFLKAQTRSWARNKARRPEDLPPEEFISREVDPILDKISMHGIQSLTPREREILEAARAKMEQRS